MTSEASAYKSDSVISLNTLEGFSEMEKYGFIYIWYDKKHKRYYVGSHWGTETDGYICSSNWLKRAKKRRPLDFKRRIIKRIYARDTLLKEESVFLALIKPNELGTKYYNLTNYPPGHWSHDINSNKTVSQKLKDAWNDENRRQASIKKLGDLNPMKNPKVVKKAQETRIKNNPDLGIWQRGVTASEEQKAKQSRVMKGREPPNKGKPSPLRGISNGQTHMAKIYKIIFEDNSELIIANLSLYCKENGHHHTSVRNSITRNRLYKGMKFLKINKT